MDTIKAVPTKDYIAQLIREEILSGGLKAGEELAQEALAAQLGLSRMPVREALQALEQEGFLVRLSNRHMQVVTMDAKQLFQTFQIAAALETEMTLLLENSSRKLLADQLEHLSIALRNEELKDVVSREISFHRSLMELLGNKYVGQMFGKLLDGYIAYAVKNTERRKEALIENLTAWESALRSDPEKISEAAGNYFFKLAEAVLLHREGCVE